MASVSIVIPCYNHNSELLNCLVSISQLSCSPSEVVVVDDGSDVPVSIDADNFPFLISVYRTRNKGLAAARNLGLSKVSSERVLFLDADDTLLSSALDHIDCLRDGCIDVTCSAFYLSANGAKSLVYPQNGDMVAAVLRCNIGPIHSFTFRTATVQKFEFNESAELRVGHEDYDFIGRLAISNAVFATFNVPTCVYEKRDGSMSSHIENMNITRLAVWSSLIHKADINSQLRLMSALTFLKLHCLDLKSYFPDRVLSVINRLADAVSSIAPNILELRYLTDSLPHELQNSLMRQATEAQTSTSVKTIINETFDWRAQDIDLLIAYDRLAKLISRKKSLGASNQIVVWGVNRIAELAISFLSDSTNLLLVDKNYGGEYFQGLQVHNIEQLNFAPNMPIFIAAHRSANEIIAFLKSRGVDGNLIF